MTEETVKVAIIIENGMVQEVLTDGKFVDVVVIDNDDKDIQNPEEFVQFMDAQSVAEWKQHHTNITNAY